MIARFLLFGGTSFYEPGGGWNDFLGAFDSADAAAMSAGHYFSERGFDPEHIKDTGAWWHVIDAETGVRIAEGP